MGEYVHRLMSQLVSKNPGEPEFHQAVQEVAESVELALHRNLPYVESKIFERIVEPERVVMFRVPWVDDRGEVQINRGFRVEMSSAIGPYKGGLRFHPTVYLGMLKFLAFEQVFKNALTTLPMGAGKGGADFDPKGKSDAEVMRFCQSFMTELQRHIGQFTDVPAGDIGVGGREIGYLFGQYTRGNELEGKTCLVSGAGNVAQYTVEKLIDLGATPVTLSDSSGFIHDKEGIDREKLDFVMELKNVRRGRIQEYAERFPGVEWLPVDPAKHYNPMWAIPADCAFPSATQNEINEEDATNLLSGGVFVVSEGANMPTVPLGIEAFVEAGILYGPGKAANAGGVAVSGLEMAQNSSRRSWSRETVDERLHAIMRAIHDVCWTTAEEYGVPGNYMHGANIAGFTKVADAMLDQGVV
jgi:glutamate dehydrogenase (NADP+)